MDLMLILCRFSTVALILLLSMCGMAQSTDLFIGEDDAAVEELAGDELPDSPGASWQSPSRLVLDTSARMARDYFALPNDNLQFAYDEAAVRRIRVVSLEGADTSVLRVRHAIECYADHDS
jgi:hypothetical protein